VNNAIPLKTGRNKSARHASVRDPNRTPTYITLSCHLNRNKLASDEEKFHKPVMQRNSRGYVRFKVYIVILHLFSFKVLEGVNFFKSVETFV